MTSPVAAVSAGVSYLTKNPFALVKAARHAAAMRAVIPLDLIRWGLGQLLKGRATPTDVVVGERPPAITLAATLEFMGQRLRAGAAIRVEEIRIGADELRVALRLSDVTAQSLDGDQTPLAQMLKAMDLSKPGNLVNFMPKRPPVLVEAKDDLLVLDLLKSPKLAANARLRKILGVVSPVMSIREVRVEDDTLLIGLRPHPTRVLDSVAALRA